MAVGHEAEVADALKTRWQRVDEKTPDKLIGFKCHRLRGLLVFAPVVFPLEGHLAVCEGKQSPIGDGNPMCVAAQAFKHPLWSAKRRLRIDHPFGPAQRGQEGGEGRGVPQVSKIPEEVKFAVFESLLKRFEE